MAGAGGDDKKGMGWFKGLFDPTAQFHAAAHTYTGLQKRLHEANSSIEHLKAKLAKIEAEGDELAPDSLAHAAEPVTLLDEAVVAAVQTNIQEQNDVRIKLTGQLKTAAIILQSKYNELPHATKDEEKIKKLMSDAEQHITPKPR